jgi:hypothetical protein
MKQVLLNMLQTLETQTTFLALIAADVAALKIVLCSLDGRAVKRLEEQTALVTDKFRAVAESQRQEIEKLRQLVSLLPTPKPN